MPVLQENRVTDMKWRLLDYEEQDPRMNLAIDEAILRLRREEDLPDTLRLWRNPSAVVLGCGDDMDLEINLEACQKLGAVVARRASGGSTMYHDLGSLNFSIIISEKPFELPRNLPDAYRILYNGVVTALRAVGVEAALDEYGQNVTVGEKRISEAAQYFLYDTLLFHGAILVDTNIKAIESVLRRRKSALTTIREQLGYAPDLNALKSTLVKSFRAALGIEFLTGELTESERETARRLYDIKYKTEKWTRGREDPASLKDVLIEVYVAYPPTAKCNEIIARVERVVGDLQRSIEMRVWMRRKGLDGKGIPPGVLVTQGLKRASKESIVPAIIVNSEIAFEKRVPSEDELKAALVKELGREGRRVSGIHP